MLDAIQYDSRQPISRIASKARMRHHSVVYTLKKLRERGVITPYLLTNPHALGLTDYCIFFNYDGDEKRARQKIIQYCTKSRQVAYFAELTGPYQFSVSLFCQTIFEVTAFFERLGYILPRASFERTFALRLQFTQFLGRMTDPNAAPITLDRVNVPLRAAIDEIDRNILGYYSQNASVSLEKVAAFARVSASTVRSRLAILEKTRVIHSFAYFIDNSKIGLTTYRIIVSAAGDERSVATKIYKYMLRHPHASAYVHCAGAWDFELNFDVENASDMGEIIEDVRDNFGSDIRKMHTISEIMVHRAHHFPIDAGIL